MVESAWYDGAYREVAEVQQRVEADIENFTSEAVAHYARDASAWRVVVGELHASVTHLRGYADAAATGTSFTTFNFVQGAHLALTIAFHDRHLIEHAHRATTQQKWCANATLELPANPWECGRVLVDLTLDAAGEQNVREAIDAQAVWKRVELRRGIAALVAAAPGASLAAERALARSLQAIDVARAEKLEVLARCTPRNPGSR